MALVSGPVKKKMREVMLASQAAEMTPAPLPPLGQLLSFFALQNN